MTAPARFRFERTNPLRLDQFLAASLPECSRSRIQQWIRAGAVRVGEQITTRPSTLVAPGTEVEVAAMPVPAGAAAPQAEAIALEILYEDKDMAAINKPPGLVVHPGAGQASGTLVNALLHRYGSEAVREDDARPGIVHRLDRWTSGVMVVARHPDAQQRLARQFQEREATKIYQALAQGAAAARGEVDLPIARDRQNRIRMSARRTAQGGGREARSSYRRIELLAGGRVSHLEVQIHTGRTHQIRVHLAAVRHPVLGDTLYGAAAKFEGEALPRPMLHAARLELRHPRSGERLTFEAPLPEDFRGWLERLRREPV